MNNPNPFVPKGSLLEQQNKRRTHMKLGVLCVLAVSVAGLMAMLIQGCKQKANPDETPLSDTNSVPTADTNTTPTDLSNQPPMAPASNTVMVPSPVTSQAQTPPSPIVTPPQTPLPAQITPVPPSTTEAGGAEYVVKKGDTLGKIARINGVSLSALEAANPDVKPTKLKVNQKLVIPAGGKAAMAETSASTGAVAETGGKTYTVKSGDTLTKIARAHHVKVKALEAANGLATTKIKVGQKLKIPSKGEAPAVTAEAPVATPTVDNTMPAPPAPVVSTSPAASTSPAPVH